MEQGFKKKFDTTKMSTEELKAFHLEDARRPPGKGPSPGSTLHQQGAQGLSKAGRYPVVLAGVAVLTGIGTLMYYRSLNVQQIPGKTNQALDNSSASAKT